MKKFLWLLLLCAGAAGAAPKVVSTIKPIHSLVAKISDGVFTPTLLIKQASPHGYQLTTADSKVLSEADLIVWTGADLETFMVNLQPKLKKDLVSLEWAKLPQVQLLATRRGSPWGEGEEHEEHHHEQGQHEHDGEEHHHEGEDDHHGAGHHHHHGPQDLHLWLSKDNSELLLKEISAALTKLDPENGAKYAANLSKALADLERLHSRTAEQLRPLANRPYLVFHDAYQYFERDFHLNARGSVRINPEQEPSAAHLAELQQMLAKEKIICVFSEPQFPAKIIDKLLADTKVKRGELDPLGAELPADRDAYDKIIGNLASNLVNCLR